MNFTKLKYFSVLALMVMLVACGPKKSKDMTAELSSLPNVSSMKIHYLSNGLKVILLEDHSKNQIDMYLLYKAGNRNETRETTGLAHLTEHTMYTGSRNVEPQEHDRLIRAAGAQSNAFTRTDYTLYYNHALPVDKLELGLRLEADRMGWPRFDAKRFEWEKKSLFNEEASSYPLAMIVDAKRKDLAYTTHAYGLGIGEDKHTKAVALSLDDCKEFHNSYYNPNNAVLVLSGNLQEDAVMKLVKKHFGAVPRGPKPPSMNDTEPKQDGQRMQRLRTNAVQPESFLSFHIPNFASKDNHALKVAIQFLYSSIKNDAMQKGLDRDFSVGAESSLDPGLFTISYVVRDEADRAAVERLVFASITKLQLHLVTDEMLLDAKDAAGSRFKGMGLMVRPYMSVASIIGEYALYGDDTYVINYDERIDAVSAADVQRVAKKYLVRDNMSAFYLAAAKQQAPQASGGDKSAEKPQLAFGYTLKPAANGMQVTAIEAGGAAEKAGMQVGDVLVKILDYPTNNKAAYDMVIMFLKSGRKTYYVIRNGKMETLKLDLAYPPKKKSVMQEQPQSKDKGGLNFGYELKAIAGGMQVTAIEAGGAADKAGMQVGDVLVKILDYPTNNKAAYDMVVMFLRPGTKTYYIVRNGEPKTLKLTLAPKQMAQKRMAPKIYIGINVSRNDQEGGGVLIEQVTPGAPSDKGGLKVGDIIMKIAGKDCANFEMVKALLPTLSPGKTPFVVRRGGKEQTIVVDIAAGK